jgi:hypothetical protein
MIYLENYASLIKGLILSLNAGVNSCFFIPWALKACVSPFLNTSSSFSPSMTKSQSNPASRHDNDFIQSIVHQDIKEFKHVIAEF